MKSLKKIINYIVGPIKRVLTNSVGEYKQNQNIFLRLKELEQVSSKGNEQFLQIVSDVEQLKNVIFNSLPEGTERQNIQFFERLYNISGGLRSTVDLDDIERLSAEVYFHHREKAEVALSACSSWYGGDYFEFGSHDLATFRNMLSAYDICAMTRSYEDVRFYAFDVFGNLEANAPGVNEKSSEEDLTEYFQPYTIKGDQIKQHEEYLDNHNLFRDKCHLVQGLFENTLTEDFKRKYKSEDRKIGFAFLDCNITSSYKTVFEFIFDLMAENSYIYMDEYLQSPSVIKQYEQFIKELSEKRNIGSVYIRNAGGFGGLFRLYPIAKENDYTLSLEEKESQAA